MVLPTEGIAGVGSIVNTGLDGLNTELLVVIPGALGVAAMLWGVPKAVKFFKRVAS